MSDYLHGLETKEYDNSGLNITDADTSSVCVIGTAPTYLLDEDINDITMASLEQPSTGRSAAHSINKIVNFSESAKCVGNNIEGFSLPDAVETILTESGGATIYTINIFNNDKHTANVDKSIEFKNGECVLSETGIQNLVLKQGEDILVLDKDYEFNNNTISILEGGKLEQDSQNVSVAYKYVDFTKITDSDVIGGIDKDGKRFGLQKIWDIMATWDVTPGIIIAPGFVSKNIRTAIENLADEIRAFAYFDTPKETNVPLIEKARLKETQETDLTTVKQRSMLLAPWVYRYNSFEDKTTLKPLSPVVAGLRVLLDRERNVAKSISNTPAKTIKGVEYPISFHLNKKDTDSNRLNAVGVTTVINYKGEYRIWGGRNCSFLKDTGIMTFESARRVRDFIQKSIENSSFVCIDENITKGFINSVLNAINDAFALWSNPLSDNHIIYGGEAYWDESLNTAEKIANGHVQFPYEECPLSNAERITFKDILNIKIINKALA